MSKNLIKTVLSICFVAIGSSSRASLVHSMRNGSIASFFMDSPSRIEQYDLLSRQWLPAVPLSPTNGTLTAGWIDSDGIYAAYGMSAYRYDQTGNNEVHLADSAQTISQILADGNILFLNRSGGLYARFTSVDKTDNSVVANFSNYIDALGGASIAPSINKMFGRSLGVSPADITYVNYNTDGTFAGGGDGPYHGSYPGASKTWVFPDDAKVVDSSGTIYSTSSLGYLGSFGSSVADIEFYGDEIPILLSGNTLTAYTISVLPTGSTTLDHSPNKIYIEGQDILTFTLSSEAANGIEVRALPLSALNPPTPGEPIDPTGLPYTPNSSFVDKNGILHLFSKANQSIFRWDTFLQQYTNTIPLVGVPEFVAYSKDNHTIYTAYASGLIREISLDDTNYTEGAFANLSGRPGGLATAGSYVFAQDPAGAWSSHYTFGADGIQIDAVDWNYYSREYIWSDANQKMYFFRDGTSPNDLLWEQINADGATYPSEPPGGIGTKKDSPLHSSSGFIHPIRVAPDGSIVVLGSGKIHDAETLARLSLALTNSVSDIAWIGDDIYTARTVDGTTQCQQWLFPAFEAGIATNYQGTANRLIALDNSKLVGVSVGDDGVPSFHVLDSGFEAVPRGLGAFSLEILEDANEGDGILSDAVQLTVSSTPASNLVVSLAVDEGAEFSVPEQVVIPAGQSSVLFDLTIFDDALLDGSKGAALYASNSWYQAGFVEVFVHDNEHASLTLSLPQTTFEGAGSIAGAVLASSPPDVDVVVELISNNSGEVGNGSAVISAGQTFAAFSLPVIDDAEIDGIQTATIEAHVVNWLGSQASVFVFDDETIGLDVQLPSSLMEGNGIVSNSGRVALSGAAQTDVHVLLTLSDSTELSVPGFVTIPAGQSEALFDITVIDDAETDGLQKVFLLAETVGYIPSSRSMDVLDNDLHHFAISGLASNLDVLASVQIGVAAKTVDGMGAPAFSNVVVLSATGDGGNVLVSPTNTAIFTGGTWSGDVVFSNIADNVVLTVDDGAGHVGTSMVFNVLGSEIVVTPDALTNTLVVAGESVTRTMVISNAGNADLEFIIHGGGEDPVDSGLILHYTFDDDSGTTVVDQSGNGNDGTIMNSCAHVDGIDGQGLETHGNSSTFSSSGGHVMLPTLDINSLSEITVTLWVKEKTMHHAHGEAYLNLGVSPASNGRINIGNFPLSSNISFAIGTNAIPYSYTPPITGEFVHYAVTYSGGMQRAYRNGGLIGQTNAVLKVDHPQYAALARHWWESGSSTSTRLSAVFDEVRIYSRSLSGVEINELYGRHVDAGLIAHFPFNGNANDESGNGHDGTVNGATLTADRFGNPDSAYGFNGSSSHINCGNIIDGFSSFTVSAWINVDRFTHSRYMGPWSQQRFAMPSVNCNYHIYTTTDSGAGFGTSMGWSDGTGLNTRVGHALPLGTWHLITQTYDGSEVRQYDNGTLINSVVSAGHTISNTFDFIIGKTCGYPGYLSTHFFDGKVDDLRVYNRALSGSEIAGLYDETDGGGDGLVARYPFSGNADDESGNGHDGTVNGATLTTDRFGNPDSAYSFDGVDDLVVVPDHDDFTVTDVSVAVWVRTTDKSDHKHITSCYGTSYYSDWYHLHLRSGSGIVAMQTDYGGSSAVQTIMGATDVADGDWHLLVGARDTSTAELRIYVDGVLEGSLPGINVSALNPDVDFWIGGQYTFASRYFKGDIDDVRIYNRALSASDVMELYLENDGTEESWLSVEPKIGSVPAGSNMAVTVRFNAAGLAAGDHLESALTVTCNDVFAPSNNVPASMWVVPPAPAMVPEPEFTMGTSNEVAWNAVAGPVEYLAETAVSTNGAHEQQSGWLSATNHVFGGLDTNTVYYYRAKASVPSAIGALEGAWSDWVQSKQVSEQGDVDADGMPNWWELRYFGGLVDSLPFIDSDGDGQGNLEEFIAGMDPTNAWSYFMIHSADTPTNGFVIHWDAVTGRVYTVHWKGTMTNAFQPLETDIHYPQSSYTDSVHQVEDRGFYSIDVELD